MLIEKRQRTHKHETGRSQDLSVFMLNSTEELFTDPPSVGRYEDQESWRFDSYGNARAARHAMQTGSPNATAMAAYEEARAKADGDIDAFRIKSIRRKRIFDETGDEACIDRYLTGDSRLWGQMRKASKNRCVTVGLMLWMSCGNAERDFAENVASGVAVAEALASAGYAVRVVGVHTFFAGCNRDSDVRGFIHPLVEYGQPIDEHALMAWGQPAACRHLGFKWVHHLYNSDEFGSGLKTPDAWLELAGVDIFLAKQWDGDNQAAHSAKVLERIAGRDAA